MSSVHGVVSVHCMLLKKQQPSLWHRTNFFTAIYPIRSPNISFPFLPSKKPLTGGHGFVDRRVLSVHSWSSLKNHFTLETVLLFLLFLILLCLRLLFALLPPNFPQRWHALIAFSEAADAMASDYPWHLWQAVVASEDRRFFRHCGIDPVGIARAALSFSAGGGGSTITQQLVKNAFLKTERTFSRKTVEMALALLLERKMSKWKILNSYLSKVSYSLCILAGLRYDVSLGQRCKPGEKRGSATTDERFVVGHQCKTQQLFLLSAGDKIHDESEEEMLSLDNMTKARPFCHIGPSSGSMGGYLVRGIAELGDIRCRLHDDPSTLPSSCGKSFSTRLLSFATDFVSKHLTAKSKFSVFQIYWGHGIYGIESASSFYFGKHPSLLSLGESAMLAGIIPSPELRSPLRDPSSFPPKNSNFSLSERGKTFQARALRKMVEAGFLDIETALLIVDQPLYLRVNGPEYSNGLLHSLPFSRELVSSRFLAMRMTSGVYESGELFYMDYGPSAEQHDFFAS
ncbi:hypothetical protein HHK36_004361 [Tetracentron sinense]|uniref:Glycosyl transferase family 51 domain-containing protein n=1 Tax=Tetracentron sinense TaxID=13715 RepID=A0A835A089_TETSI|nr:hypothetical protein HHK36_004361 [Tetracentron sinense]